MEHTSADDAVSQILDDGYVWERDLVAIANVRAMFPNHPVWSLEDKWGGVEIELCGAQLFLGVSPSEIESIDKFDGSSFIFARSTHGVFFCILQDGSVSKIYEGTTLTLASSFDRLFSRYALVSKLTRRPGVTLCLELQTPKHSFLNGLQIVPEASDDYGKLWCSDEFFVFTALWKVGDVKRIFIATEPQRVSSLLARVFDARLEIVSARIDSHYPVAIKITVPELMTTALEFKKRERVVCFRFFGSSSDASFFCIDGDTCDALATVGHDASTGLTRVSGGVVGLLMPRYNT
jgi:hypothetical protein